MTSSFNITSAVFGAALKKPISGSLDGQGEVVNESSGTDPYISDQKLVRRKTLVTVAFNDIGDFATLWAKRGTEDTLVIVIPHATGGGSSTATISNAMLVNVVGGGEHAAFGTFIGIFEARSSDGTTDPVAWS